MVKVSFNKQIRVQFPHIEGSEVVINDTFNGEDFIAMQKFEQSEVLFQSLAKMIVSWNLEDEEGNVLPINVETLKKFDVLDIKALYDETTIGRRSKEIEEKKS